MFIKDRPVISWLQNQENVRVHKNMVLSSISKSINTEYLNNCLAKLDKSAYEN